MNVLLETQMTITTQAQHLPNIPEGAVNAILILESGSATSVILARFRESGNPTSTLGMPLGDLGRYDVEGKTALSSFKITSADGNTHKLNIQYRG